MHYELNPLYLVASSDLERAISNFSIQTVSVAGIVVVLLIFLTVLLGKKASELKPLLFWIISVVVIGTTVAISGATFYLNGKSETGGLVNWHAAIEFWACGNELELRDPSGALNNRIGSPTLHEHNDKRIHVEGVPVLLSEDASLGQFMNVVGGSISKNSLIVPLNDNEEDLFENLSNETDSDGDGSPRAVELYDYILTNKQGRYARLTNGQACSDQPSEVQVFVYKYNKASGTYSQKKLESPASYIISQEENIPPGDCIIVEFGPTKNSTSKICKQIDGND